MAPFTDTLKDVSTVAGAALLGASGPSGRGSATSLLNNRLRLLRPRGSLIWSFPSLLKKSKEKK